jgi:hypothetical protein
MVVHRHGQLLLGGVLPHDILIETFFEFLGLWQREQIRGGFLGLVILEDRVAHRHALIADVGLRVIPRGRDQLADHFLTLVAERTA